MRKVSELGRRYAEAVFEIAKENSEQDRVLEELRVLNEGLFRTPESIDFLTNPLVSPSQKEEAVFNSVGKDKLSQTSQQLLKLLVQKSRLEVFPDIAQAFVDRSDLENKVTRGEVQSAGVLNPEERQAVEQLISDYTKKKVILQYSQDESLIGGLVAQVGSYRFDDSIESHLRRMREDLKRSVH